ncbi:MAG: ArsR family transcriptional regulator [Halobacteriales archaeon]|nr:ArsR family transcriptional regulator [Halobacteriales archaeon]
MSRLHALAGALLLAGVGGWAMEARDSPQAVSGDIGLTHALVTGRVQVSADDGALLLRGLPAQLTITARHLVATWVHVEQEHVRDVVGGDHVLVLGEGQDSYDLVNGTVVVAVAGPAPTVLYAFAEAGRPCSFTIGPTEADGEPFHPIAEDVGLTLGDAGQSYAFAHVVPAPSFGLAHHGDDGLFDAALDAFAVRGDFTLAIDEADVVLGDARQEVQLRTGQWDMAEGPAVMPAQVERAYLRIVIADGELRGRDPGEGRFVAGAPSYAVDGRVAVADGSGWLGLGGARRGLGSEDVVLVGNVTVHPRAEPSTGAVLPIPPTQRARGSVEGDATEVMVAGTPWLVPRPPAVGQAGIAALLVGVLLAAGVLAQKGWLPFAFPLYARLLSRDLLGNSYRQRLLDAVAARPFIHLRDLERASGFGYGCVVYHMHVLKREHLVASVKTPSHEHFFVPRADMSRDEMRRLVHLADPTRRRIVQLLVARPGRSQADLCGALGIDQGLLSRHLARMTEAGLVHAQGARNKRYAAAALAATWVVREPSHGGVAPQLSAA